MQKQPDKPTVQGEIEKALRYININSEVLHAGRTDRGVHALNQVISFKADDKRDPVQIRYALNKILNPYIHIKKIEKTNLNFHPRFSAKKRSYRYLISNRYSPFTSDYITYYPYKMNIMLLKKALSKFEGRHNFEFFAKTESEVASYEREIYKTDIFEYKNLTVIKITGNGFLRAQIRLIINSLFYLNENRITLEMLQEQIDAKKLYVKHPATPCGLYLERIWY